MEHLGPRELRLRPEFAEYYPGLPAGEWLPMPRWAEALVARAQQARRLSVPRRTFDPDHFDFRGGAAPRGAAGLHVKTRAEDC